MAYGLSMHWHEILLNAKECQYVAFRRHEEILIERSSDLGLRALSYKPAVLHALPYTRCPTKKVMPLRNNGVIAMPQAETRCNAPIDGLNALQHAHAQQSHFPTQKPRVSSGPIERRPRMNCRRCAGGPEFIKPLRRKARRRLRVTARSQAP
jgi:hypothetical protein